ncbi:transketolase [Facklamia miroungae]|uniref:Transketolase n=1 Tax=Facklamia miroungae TaxID=120956 RepID=A0A1G7SJH6_9LACT|nr:transketolase [Facklamia miroungae]NKZ29633.1 transketolase [Facklamia miroungae]SDG23042.1 transketolase [Facklamia miroungae]
MFSNKDQIAVNTIRALSIDQIEAANSGHPGLPLGAAPMAYSLWSRHLNINPKDSQWINRDRFVLSAGHGSAMLYSLLHLAGFEVSMDDLKQFRQLGSKTPGHPEYGHTHGVEATTGPLGQGIAQAVGMAMAEQHTAALYNTDDHKVIDHYTYALVGDGDLMEGISYEACSFAGRQKLGKLVVLYDSNDISLDGDLNQAFVEDIKQRFESQKWHYQKVEDGNDLEAISKAIEGAKEVTDRPSIIEVKTVIGFGSPNQGTSKVHGAPLGAEAWSETKVKYGYQHEAFTVPEETRAAFNEKVIERGQNAQAEWQKLFDAYREANPELANELMAAFENKLPENYGSELEFLDETAKAEATRSSSGKAIQGLKATIPYLWGGSADLSGSNKTMINDTVDFMPESRQGQNIWFGVREFAMGAMMNGAALHGGNKIYAGTFFVFSDYLKAAIRLSALSQLPVTYVLTHDSIAVGEDGPTHEPIEHLAAFRAMPNLNVIRPADANETMVAWKIAVESQKTPTMLVLSRQNLPIIQGSKTMAEEGVRKGAYIISPAKDEAQGILIATGSEVSTAIEAQALLAEKGVHVNVVSMPAQNIFDQQSNEYKEAILPKQIKNRASIEMGASFGWHKYIGMDGLAISIDEFGTSAPGDRAIEHFGFTADKIAQAYLNHFKS